MATWQEVPIEIFQWILAYINSPQELLQCQLVCKTWYPFAQKLIYSTVTFNSQKATLRYVDSVIASVQHLGLLTNTVYFNYKVHSLGEYISEINLERLATACPNIKRLETLVPQKDDLYFGLLMKIYTELPEFERIPESNIWGASTYYTMFVLKLSKTLTHLTLTQLNELLINNKNGYYEKIIQQTFPQLRTLEIIMDEGRTLSRFDEFLQACPVLHTLRCLDKSKFKNQENQSIQEAEREHSGEICDLMPDHIERELDLSIIESRPDIKICEGCFVINSGESILYFMHKLPQLEKLDIQIDCDFDFECASEFNFNIKTMTTFLKYISTIPSFCVDNLCMPNTVGVLKHFMQSTHYTGIIEIEYQKPLYDNLKLWTGTNPKLKFENYYISQKTKQQKITVTFPLDSTELDPTSVEKDLFLPHISMLCRMQGVVKQLHLGESFGERAEKMNEMESKMADWMGSEPSYDVYGLNEIFNHCISLQVLSLNLLQLMECEPSDTEGICKSLGTLDIYRSNLSTLILPQLSARLPNLKYLKLRKCTMITETCNTIIIHMPETEFHTISCNPTMYDITTTDFYLKLKTLKYIRYLKSHDALLNTCTIQEYNDSLQNLNIASLDIDCQLLKYLIFKIGKTEERRFTL